MGAIKTLVTQNVDNLHQDAGSRSCIEFHGNLMECNCRRARGRQHTSPAALLCLSRPLSRRAIEERLCALFGRQEMRDAGRAVHSVH